MTEGEHIIDEHGAESAPRELMTAEGTHVLLDMIVSDHLDDPVFLERQLRKAANAAGATVIGASFHHFGPQQGVTGVLLLAESHISIHSWPERNFAAIDLFLCGRINGADMAVAALVDGLAPESIAQKRILRGADRHHSEI